MKNLLSKKLQRLFIIKTSDPPIKVAATDAENASAAIIAEAEKKAAQIVADAEAKAENILKSAKTETERMEKSSKDAIAQAGRNLLISFRDGVTVSLDALIKKEVTEA